MALGDHLGYIGLLIALVGIALTILWPTKRWIGYACFGLAAVVALWWAHSWFTAKEDTGKLTPTISWFPAPLKEGAPLDSSQLNAQAFVDNTPLDGDFVYNPAIGSTLPVGKDTLFVRFVPSSPRFNPVEKSVTVNVSAALTNSLPQALRNPLQSAFKFEGIGYITVDSSGAARLPIWMTVPGTGTTHYRSSSFSYAIIPKPQDFQKQFSNEKFFWDLYLKQKRQHAPGPVMATAAGTGKLLVEVELGDEISKQMPVLKTKGGTILVALEQTSPASTRVISQMCLVIDMPRNFAYLCQEHNKP